MAEEGYSHLSSSLLRQIALFRGPLKQFLPPLIKDALEQRVRERRQGETQ
jgi:phosphopantetheine adenylyltransferase